MRMCAIKLYSFPAQSCMFHKQSMDILWTARNVSRARAFNYACTHDNRMATVMVTTKEKMVGLG